MRQFTSTSELATILAGCHFVDAEFMYRPRPEEARHRKVFDYCLRTRLNALGKHDAVVFICDSNATIDSLTPYASEYPTLTMAAIITNPTQFSGKVTRTPFDLGWDQPAGWRKMQTTDRWARIDRALEIGGKMDSSGFLLMPAHDAVWGYNLLKILEQFSHSHAKNGLPAAVSPYTYFQHSSVPDVDIPADIIHLLNTALNRDTWLQWKIRMDRLQAFWGKMSMTPFDMCKPIRQQAEQTLWEDDLDIDRIIRDLGYNVRCLWVDSPQLYRQALPVFDRAAVRSVIERTLHYSLYVPSDKVGGSSLNTPLDWAGKLRTILSPRFRRYNPEAERLIQECATDIQKRLINYGAAWLDWGAYRHVVRMRDPVVEVWQQTKEDVF